MSSLRRALVPFGLSLAVALAVAAGAGAEEPVAYEVVGDGIPEPLTATPGDPARGQTVARNAANATCLICHDMPIPEEPDPGDLAPSLRGVGNRYTAAQLRLRLVDPKRINPDTIMPAYYRTTGFNRVLGEHVGETIYSAQDIEDVVAYLTTLRDD